MKKYSKNKKFPSIIKTIFTHFFICDLDSIKFYLDF